MKNFIVINEAFTCKNCGAENPKLSGSCRNHCLQCLYSLHLDKDIPGDRKSHCKSLMKPLKLSRDGKKGWIIHHLCIKCKKSIPNKAAADDNFEEIVKLSTSTITKSC